MAAEATKRGPGRPPTASAGKGKGGSRASSSSAVGKLALSPEVCSYGLSMMFGMIATARGPVGQWERTPEQCLPAAEPMAELLKRLPESAADKIAQFVPVVGFVSAMWLLSAPSLQQEQRYALAVRASNGRIPTATGTGAINPNTGAVSVSNRANSNPPDGGGTPARTPAFADADTAHHGRNGTLYP